jgi:hypothetical protein
MEEGIKTIREFLLSRYSNFDYSLAPFTRNSEDRIIEEYPYLKIRRIPQSYRRYGYALSDFVARKFLYEWLEEYGAIDKFEDLGIKIVNSGRIKKTFGRVYTRQS